MSEQKKQASRYEKLDELIVERIRKGGPCKSSEFHYGACGVELLTVTRSEGARAYYARYVLYRVLQHLRKKGVIRAVDRKLWVLTDAA